MAVKDTEKTAAVQQPEIDYEELVEYTAPFAASPTDREILVAVNGETIRIMRGETVMIKRKFVEVLKNAAQQERAAYLAMAAAQQSGAKAIADM